MAAAAEPARAAAVHPGRASIVPLGDILRELGAPPSPRREEDAPDETGLGRDFQVDVEIRIQPGEIVLFRTAPVKPHIQIKVCDSGLHGVRYVGFRAPVRSG